MKRLSIAGLALALIVHAGGAHAQLDLSGAVPPTRAGQSAARPADASPGAPRAASEPRKADRSENDFVVSLASAVGRPLRLNGRDGELTLWGREKALKIAKLVLAGTVISDPSQKCRIDIVGAGPIEAKSLGRPDGLARFEAEIPACPFSFDVVEDGVLVPAQEAACVFQAADCQASPSGLWGAEGAAAVGDAKEIATEKTRADDAANRILKSVKARFKSKSDIDGLEREQGDLVARGQKICHDYDRESEHGFCASRMAEARAALLKARAERLMRGDKAQD